MKRIDLKYKIREISEEITMIRGSVFKSVPKRFLAIPLVAILLFITAMAVFLLLLSAKERETESLNVVRQAEWIKKTANQKMMANQRFLFSIADTLPNVSNLSELQNQVLQHLNSNIELLSISYVLSNGEVSWTFPQVVGVYEEGKTIPFASQKTLKQVAQSFRLAYSPVFLSPKNGYVFEVQVPVYKDGKFQGVVIGSYSLERFLMFLMPASFQNRYGFVFYDLDGNKLKSSNYQTASRLPEELFALGAPANNMTFKLFAIEQGGQIIRDMLLILVIGLSILVVFGFGGLLQHMHLRLKAEQVRDQFFNLSLDIFCILYPDGRFHLVNPTFGRLLGYHNVNSRVSFFDILLPEEVSAARQDFAKLVSGEQTFLLKEYHCRCADGAEVWIEWAIQPDSLRHFYYAAAHDITMRKNRELDLEAEHMFQKEIENSMTTGIRVINLEGRIIYVNPAFCRMTGLSEEAMLNCYPPYPYWHPEEIGDSHQLSDQIMSGDFSMSGIEMRFYRADGSDFYARLYMSPLTKEGRISGWMTIFIDVTERKKAQKAIEGAYDQFMRVFDSLDLAVSVCGQELDGQPEILFANGFYRDLFGPNPKGHLQLIKQVALTQYDRVTSEGFSGSYPLPLAMKEGEVVEGQVYCDETKRWFEVRVRQIKWIDDRTVQLLHATDITERKAAEAMYEREQEKLQFNSRLVAMGEMASSLAHELNQPLTAITNYAKGSIGRLKNNQMTIDALESVLEKIAGQGDRAGEIIKRIRSFVQKSTPKRECLLLIDLIDNALAFADIEARKNGLRIERDFPNIPVMVLADSILIEQVVFNLLKNAIDAMEASIHRIIKISVSILEDNYVKISVFDKGVGITEEANEEIYTAFFTTKAKGMGMGLNICRSIIELHNGRIWYESSKEAGTVFHFTLPIYHISLGVTDGLSDRIYH